LLGLPFNPENEGSTFLCNIGGLLLDYMTLQPRRYCSSKSSTFNIYTIIMYIFMSEFHHIYQILTFYYIRRVIQKAGQLE
jgi:hypothetical protein